VQGLRRRFPAFQVAISTTTLTGQNLARDIFRDETVRVFYFPFDWRWVVRRSLKAIHPNVVLIMETELWPGFLRECQAQQIPVALVNGRLSEQSYRRYRLIKPFIRQVLSAISIAVMQSERDAARLASLGMNADKLLVSGNLKFDAGTLPADDLLSREFRERFQLDGNAPLVLAASTHDPEEVILLNTFRQVLVRSGAKLRLMIAPRHPERFAEVADFIKASGLRWVRRTAPPKTSDGDAEVILLDSIGELHSAYSLATIVFVGGSLARTGGHNILEPAAVGAAVITGPHTYNFQFIVETFVQAGAIIQLQPQSDSGAIVELGNVILELLAEPARRIELGSRAQKLVKENRGATERTLDLLQPIFTQAARANSAVTSPQ
jgi:3-deoxy-D-manno-octulosonic-acid transferase